MRNRVKLVHQGRAHNMFSRFLNLRIHYYFQESFFVLFFVQNIYSIEMKNADTGKSLSEALIFTSINPQYDNRLFLELP